MGRGTGHGRGTQEEAILTRDETGHSGVLARETTALLCPPVPQMQPEGIMVTTTSRKAVQ